MTSRSALASAAGAISVLLASALAAGQPLTLGGTVAADLPGREPGVDAVARRLGTSARTLQRRLEVEGTSFARLVDEVRRERAEAFLRANDVSVAEVSWLVGFSEQSAFTRAFRRWTGSSPTEFRRGAATPPSTLRRR